LYENEPVTYFEDLSVAKRVERSEALGQKRISEFLAGTCSNLISVKKGNPWLGGSK
jgi:hypothetical protein